MCCPTPMTGQTLFKNCKLEVVVAQDPISKEVLLIVCLGYIQLNALARINLFLTHLIHSNSVHYIRSG